MWWNLICQQVHDNDILDTPGRGLTNITRQKQFQIISINANCIQIVSGHSKILLERACFEAIETYFNKNPHGWLRCASLKANCPLPDSVDEKIRIATGSSLSRGNYVSSILVHSKLVKYVMNGNRKVIERI